MDELVVATQNSGKLREVQQLLAELPVRWRSLDAAWAAALPPEGLEYEANARAKAVAVAMASGCIAVADDSGLEVDALGGAPGPLSARYGGVGLDDAGRNAHLLAELAALPGARRDARFVCVAAVAAPSGECEIASGECAGRILDTSRGEGGFGYDPLFWVAERGVAMAELDQDAKHAVSHRGRAFRALIPIIRRLLDAP